MRRSRSLGRLGTIVLVVGLFGYIALTFAGELVTRLVPSGWGWVAVVPAVWAVDRLLVAAESRGWVYWRHRTVSRTSLGNAMLEIQALYEPAAHAVVEERVRKDADLPGVGAPPDPDDRDEPARSGG